MFAFFLLPATMAIGTGLVSAPIVIHLINRMRFKRIRWAAMEFLLKSQKRNRRRLIIEQLLLLLLRCLLVLLAAFILARFLGCAATGGAAAQATWHVVLLDDTLSMQDEWKDEGQKKTSFTEGKRLIQEIARAAAQAGAAQQYRVVLLSRLTDPPVFDERLNDESLRTLASRLDEIKPSDLHVPPIDGVKAADEYFGEKLIGRKILHFVSDLRNRDWSGPEGEVLHQQLDTVLKKGIQVNLVDTAHPSRNAAGQATQAHENVAILDLTPQTRVSSINMPVTITARLQNFTNVDRDGSFFTIKVDGAEVLGGRTPISRFPAHSIIEETFQVTLAKIGYNQISISLDRLEPGLEADDKRYTVVEVRHQVPILIIDGDGLNGQKPGGDTFHLSTVYTTAKGYQVVARGPRELEQGGLEQYPSIFLCNVADLTDKAVANLEDYVRNGGSVCFFLGDKVRTTYYNNRLYNAGKGLFPVPLELRPTDPLTPEEKEARQRAYAQQLFIRSSTHPVVMDLYPMQLIFAGLSLDRHHPAQSRSRWQNTAAGVEELATLPNRNDMDVYKAEAQRLMRKLPRDDEKYAKYKPGLDRHFRDLQGALESGKLYRLGETLQAMLLDRGDPKDPQRPDITQFFNLTEQQPFREEIEKFRETVQYGDPLILSSRYGKGKVVTFLTTAGKAWHDWPGGCDAEKTYPILISELQKYLTSGGDDLNRIVGSTTRLELDATRYEPRIRRFYLPEAAELAPPKDGEAPAVGGIRDLGEQLADKTSADDIKDRIPFTVAAAREPGLYLLELYPRPTPENPDVKPERRAYVFNVDAASEGDLQRAVKEDLERNPTNRPADRGKITLMGGSRLDLDEISQRQRDTSEAPWVFLVFLLVLVIEQALAVHLSFHLKGNEAALPAGMRPESASAGAAEAA